MRNKDELIIELMTLKLLLKRQIILDPDDRKIVVDFVLDKYRKGQVTSLEIDFFDWNFGRRGFSQDYLWEGIVGFFESLFRSIPNERVKIITETIDERCNHHC